MRHSAFTLLEILVVLTIIGVLMAIGMANYSQIQNSALRQAAQAEMKQFAVAVTGFKMDYNRAPADLDELLTGGYITKSLATDPWGMDYQLEANAETSGLRVHSAGPDKKFGTADDLFQDESL